MNDRPVIHVRVFQSCCRPLPLSSYAPGSLHHLGTHRIPHQSFHQRAPTGTNGHHRSGVYSYPSTLVYYSIIIVCSALPWPGQRGQPVIFASHLARPNVAHCAVQHAHSSPSPYLRSSNSPTSSSRASALHGLWRTTSRSPWHTPSPSALRGIPRRLLEIRREEPNKQSAMCAMP